MSSLSGSIKIAMDRKKVPAFQPGSMASLGQALGLTEPFSIKNIIANLNGLPPASIVIGPMNLDTRMVHGWAILGLQSDGGTSFKGALHTDDAVGSNYIAALTLRNIKDPYGRTVVFAHSGYLKGHDVPFSDHNDNWQSDGFSQDVKDQWDTIKSGPGTQTSLHTQDDPWSEILSVVEIIVGTAIVIVTGWAICKWLNNNTSVACIVQQRPNNPDQVPGPGY